MDPNISVNGKTIERTVKGLLDILMEVKKSVNGKIINISKNKK